MKRETTFSRKVYVSVYLSLMALLLLSWALAYAPLGSWNTTVSLLIAALKAVLVAAFFMHLRLSDGLHRLFALAGIFWLVILVGFAMADVLSRSWLWLPGKWP